MCEGTALLEALHVWIIDHPRRSATDLAAYVVHDIKTAFNSRPGKVATLLTKDVTGAFNAVYKFRLVV